MCSIRYQATSTYIERQSAIHTIQILHLKLWFPQFNLFNLIDRAGCDFRTVYWQLFTASDSIHILIDIIRKIY